MLDEIGSGKGSGKDMAISLLIPNQEVNTPLV